MGNFLKPYICTQCGGRVNPETLTCEMCGTKFKQNKEYMPLIVEQPGAHTLCMRQELRNEMIEVLGLKEASRRAIEHMALEFADSIAPFMSIKTEHDPYRGSTVMRGTIRVLDPDYRF